MAAPGGVLERVGQCGDQCDHEDHPKRHRRAADLKLGAEDLQQARVVLDVLAADGLVGGIQEIRRQHDLPHAQRHNEGRQFHVGDQPAVDQAADGADHQAHDDGKLHGQAVGEDHLTHHHRRQHHDRAHAQVDARGQNYQALRGGDDAHDLHLLQDQGHGEGREEALAHQHAEQADRRDQHDQRHKGRVHMQQVLQLADEAFAGVLELGDGLGRVGGGGFKAGGGLGHAVPFTRTVCRPGCVLDQGKRAQAAPPSYVQSGG